MAGAFQNTAFQNSAFQVEAVAARGEVWWPWEPSRRHRKREDEKEPPAVIDVIEPATRKRKRKPVYRGDDEILARSRDIIAREAEGLQRKIVEALAPAEPPQPPRSKPKDAAVDLAEQRAEVKDALAAIKSALLATPKSPPPLSLAEGLEPIAVKFEELAALVRKLARKK